MYRVDCYVPVSGQLISTTWKRYSEFVTLNRELALAGEPKLNLPPKKTLGTINLEERRLGLERALQVYTQGRCQLAQPLANFLCVTVAGPDALVTQSALQTEPGNHSGQSIVDNSRLSRITTADTLNARELEQQSKSTPVAETKCKSDQSNAAQILRGADELLRADVALKTAISAADEMLVDRSRQNQLGRVAVVLFVASLFARRLRRSWNKTLSVLILGASGGLSFGLFAARRDVSRRGQVVQVVKERAAELSAKLHTLLGEGSSTPPVASVISQAKSSTNSQTHQGNEVVPKALVDVAGRSLEMMTKHLHDDVNAFGCPWVESKNSNGLQILRSKVPGQARMVWKGKFIVNTACSVSQIMDEFRNWEKRLKHDQTFRDGAILQKFTDEYDIDRCYTKQILTVSSREFVHIRSWRVLPNERGFAHTFTTLTSEDMPGLPAPVKGIIRGDNMAGCGMQWTLLDCADGGGSPLKNNWEVRIVAEGDPKGWIPTSVINAAMTMQLSDSARGLLQHFGSM
jgi:hypothetical protein